MIFSCAWMAGNMPLASIPALISATGPGGLAAGLGLLLLGGRLLSGDEGPAAMLMYEDQKGQRLSVLLASPGTDLETGLKVQESGNLIACTWQDGKLAVAVAGEMARDPMMVLAKAVYEKLEG